MAVLRSLVTTLGMNSAQYRADLKRAQKSTRDFSVQVKNVAKVSATAFLAAGTAAAGMATVLIRESLSSNDALAKFADKIGITTDALGGLQHAGELTGVSTQTMNMGLQRMTRRVSDAAQGTGEAVKALDELGLSAEDLSRLSPDEQFKRIATAMEGVESQSDKVRLAFKLFDSEGTALLNTLDAGAEGINAMMAEADALGITMTRIDAAKLEQANDALYKAGLGSKALGNTLSVAVSPYITAIANQFTEASKASNGFKEEVMSGMEVVAKGVGYAANAVHGLEVSFVLTKQAVRELELAFVQFAHANSEDNPVQNILKSDPVAGLAKITRKLDETGNAFFQFAKKSAPVSFLVEYGKAIEEQEKTVIESSRNTVAELTKEIEQGRQALHEKLNEPLPYEGVQGWFANVRAEAERTAQEVAASKQQTFSVPGASGDTGETGDTDKMEGQLEKLRQQYASEQELLLEKTLTEQELLINAEAAKLLSEQESQALRQQSWQAYYDSVAKAADDSAQQQAKAQQRTNQQMVQMQVQLMQQAVGLIKSTAEEGSALWMAALATEKGIAIAQALINSEVAAVKALAEVPYPANIGVAAQMRTMGYASAALIAATGVAEIAGARADGGEVRYGQTYLVGERGPELFTAGATGQITSHENLQRAIGSESAANQPIQQITFAPQIVVESGASQGDDEELAERAGEEGYNRVIEDLQTNGPISQLLRR